VESLTSNATDLAVPCSLAVAPLSLVLQPGAGVHVPALAVTQVVLPLADVLVAVGVEVVAAAGATVVRPFTCSSTLPHQHTLRGRSRAGAVRSGTVRAVAVRTGPKSSTQSRPKQESTRLGYRLWTKISRVRLVRFCPNFQHL